MLRSLISVVVNIVYCVVLNLTLFTDRAVMPGGEVRQWRHSAIGRLGLSGQSALVYLQLFFTAVSLVTSGMMLFGVKTAPSGRSSSPAPSLPRSCSSSS